MKPSDLDRYARIHRGLTTFDEARRLGVSRQEWNQAIVDGQLDRLHRNVARLYGAPISTEQRIQAAVLAAGPGAMASHRSAARLWGLERPETDPIDVMLPSRSRRARLADVVIHRPRDLVDLSGTWRHGILTTNPLRTLVDLGAVAPAAVEDALRRFVVDGLLAPKAARALLLRHARPGRAGVRALRAALDAWAFDDRPIDSDLEEQMALIREHFDLPPMRFHAIVGGYEVDFHIVGTNIVVECDGWSTHGVIRDQFEFDRVRDANLLAQGIVTQRITWRQMVGAPERAAKRIEQIVERWAPGLLARHRARPRNSGRHM